MITNIFKCCGRGRPRDPDLAESRREEILAQAIPHFASKGFAGADVGEIATAAGLAKGTVYRYFENKRALFRASVDQVMLGLIESTSSMSDMDPLEGVAHGVRAFLAYFDAHPEYIELLVQERAEFRDREIPSYMRFQDVGLARPRESFNRLIADGRFRDMPVDRYLEIIGDMLYGFIYNNHFAGRPASLESQAEDIIDLLLLGLLTPEAATKWRARQPATDVGTD